MPLALITGASRGIGRAIAIALAEAGHDIIINYRSNESQAQAVAALIKTLGRQAHLAPFDIGLGQQTQESVAALIEEFGCPDILVNNAGITDDGLFVRLKAEAWDQVLSTNLSGFYSVTRPILRQMLRHRFGRIINISSISGVRGNPGQVNYSASKAGLIGATKALALEVASRNITVNAVAPGFVETDMTENLPMDEIVDSIPMKRAGTPEDIAHAVAFLASNEASYITGQVLSVNGGLYT